MNTDEPFKAPPEAVTPENLILAEETTRCIYGGVAALRKAAYLPENANFRDRLLERACELADIAKRLDSGSPI